MGASVCVVVGGGGRRSSEFLKPPVKISCGCSFFFFFCFIWYSLLNTASKLAHTGMKRDGGEGVGRGVFTER